MTETCTTVTMWPITQRRGISGSKRFLVFSESLNKTCFLLGCGHLLPGTVARVVKPDGSLAGYDEPGEFVIKTISVALGYANNLQA